MGSAGGPARAIRAQDDAHRGTVSDSEAVGRIQGLILR